MLVRHPCAQALLNETQHIHDEFSGTVVYGTLERTKGPQRMLLVPRRGRITGAKRVVDELEKALGELSHFLLFQVL